MNRYRSTRGAAPKISLVLTGIETFAVLIAALVVFISGRRISSDAAALTDSSGSSDSLLEELLGIFEGGLSSIASTMLTIVAVILLIVGVWYLIFWIVCAKSKHHRVRQIICTFIGRIPGIILAVLLASAGMVGMVFLFIILWIFLNIILSAFGWKKNRSSR